MEAAMRLTFTMIILAGIPASAVAQTDPTYWQDIRPILRKHCTACHATKHVNKIDVSGGLALDTFEAAKKGSKRSVITPGKSAKSVLYQMLVTEDVATRMPLDAEPLSQDKIDLVKRWIDSGAKEGTPPAEVAVIPAK